MKVAILAGGMGSRLAEETAVRPKPLVEIGQRPILWHIMKIYAAHGLNEFVVAAGYKGDMIKRWFADYASLAGDVTVRLRAGTFELSQREAEDWVVHVVDTGPESGTGGRIKRLERWLGDGTFLLTWGDGVGDVDVTASLAFHRAHGRLATMTAVRPPARYGHLVTDGDRIVEFTEKPQIGEGWINGAFFVLEPDVHQYIDGDHVMFEREPLERLAKDGQLMAYRHHGFWQCMDTLRERRILEDLWSTDAAPWKVW
ncbi:MAG: glucose-1-phosphate cytidylyltransferase [Actinomycetes bacterium]